MAKKFKVRGINVILYEKSFSIENPNTIIFPPYINQENVTNFIEALYDAIEKKCQKSANEKVANKVLKLLSEK